RIVQFTIEELVGVEEPVCGELCLSIPRDADTIVGLCLNSFGARADEHAISGQLAEKAVDVEPRNELHFLECSAGESERLFKVNRWRFAASASAPAAPFV